MKALFLGVALLGWLVLDARDLRAQAYVPYDGLYGDVPYQQYLQYQHYLQWQDYLEYLRQTDPYYALHVMHYQLYLQPSPTSHIKYTNLAVTRSAYPRGHRRSPAYHIELKVEHRNSFGEGSAELK